RLRHSSRKRPLKLSFTPFCEGLPGSMNRMAMPASRSHCCSRRAMNSPPLSQRRWRGGPCFEEVATGRVPGLSEDEYRAGDAMRVRFHPGFPHDQRRFEADCATISAGLAARFRAVERAGVPASQPDRLSVFVLYGYAADSLIFGAIIPTRSDR